VTAELIATRGLPGSGKTSWSVDVVNARAPGSVVRVGRDDIRAMLFGPLYRKPIHACEEQVTAVQRATVEHALRHDQTVIVDDMNLRVGYLKGWAQLAAKLGAPFRVQTFDTDVEECVARDAHRAASGGRSVGEDVIRDLWQRFRGNMQVPTFSFPPPIPVEPYTARPGTPPAIIVDIDGTVALHDGVRGPYDTSRYHLDNPNRPVIEQVRMAAAAGLTVLFTSGRDRDFEVPTARWLGQHVVTDGMVWDLFMRPAGDIRNDAIVKRELFDQHIRERFDVRWVLDDRNRVVAMWRDLGLSVMQVADGDF
jgi:predicted kinase